MKKPKLARILGLWIAPFMGLAALAVALFLYFYTPGQRTNVLSLTAGQKQTTRNQVALALQNAGTTFGIQMEIHECAGSEDALDRVNAGKLDLALVQGGLRVDGRPNVRQVATLNIEPLHLLVKKELLDRVSKNLAALEGKTVNVGTIGSGTNSLASESLAFAGLHPQNGGGKGGYVATRLSSVELLAENDRSRLPDAVLLVSCLPSEMTKYLVNERDYRLVPLPFGEAFSLDGLRTDAGRLPSATGGRVVRGRVQAVVIPAFTYHVEPPVPPTELPTLGTRLLLVTHKDVDAGAVQRLVETVYATEFATVLRPPLDVKLLELPPEFPWHQGTRVYQERNTPVVSGMVMDSAHKGFAIFAAAASGMFVLWQWLRQRNQFLRDRGFSKYINKITYIEETAMRAERDQIGGVELLQELRMQLAGLKSEALARFTEGELSGHELMQGFLVQVNDVRDYVQALIREHETPASAQRNKAPLESGS
jgi:TRAP-type uncharacterized transport system substrate-binding protein